MITCGNILFEDSGLKKHNKAEILHEIEETLREDDHRIYITNYKNTTIIEDFMSAIRKVPLNKLSCNRDTLENIWNMVTK